MYFMQKFWFILAFAMCTICANKLYAQQSLEGETLDKIEAVVGAEIVLKSDVDAQIFQIMQSNRNINPNDPKVRNYILDALINEKLMLQKAIEDSIPVNEDEINQQMEYTIQRMVAQFGSEKRLEDVYQMPISRIKRDYRDEIRKQILTQQVRERQLAMVKVTQKEVDEFYKMYKDSIPTVGDQVELAHIVKYISASSSSKEKAFNLAKAIRDSLIAGGDFAAFAKRYSNDGGTADKGGDLGFMNKSGLVPEYVSGATKLQPGEISMPVESPFGYHIIQLIDKTTDQINTRHILIKVQQSGDDIEQVKKTLEEMKEKIEKGSITFEEAARNFSDEKETKGFGGNLGKSQISSLEESLKGELEKLKDGSITPPLPYSNNQTKPAMHIVLRKKTITNHKATLETDFKEIERLATTFKQNSEYEKFVKKLRDSIYWERKQ